MARRAKKRAFLTLGGTGVIGSAMAALLAREGIAALSVSLSPDARGEGGENRRADLAACSTAELGGILEAAAAGFELVGLLDLVGLKSELVPILAGFAARRGAPVSVISSCLLYDHDGSRALDETAPVIPVNRARHPYLLSKLAIEAAWQQVADCDWTLFRTHHVLGRGALLGCVPAHNRDPALLATLRAGGPLRLVGRGAFRLSFIHPADFAAAVMAHGGKGDLARQVANLVHPEPVRAADYYHAICDRLGIPRVAVEPAEIAPDAFWALTAKDNVFSTRHAGLARHRFCHDLAAAIDDSLSVGPEDYARLGGHMFTRIAGG